jgi:dTDP-4-amino-4,6-dideoxygalactose transaminase
MKEIPLSAPNLNMEIADNLRECIKSGWVSTSGPFIGEFEEKIAHYTGLTGAVGCQSGTAGLHTALRRLGVEAGDIVICPTLTFIAAVNPVRYQGAEPVFIDCDDSLCMDPVKLGNYLREDCRAEETPDGSKRVFDTRTGKTVKVIVVVHVFGVIADMERIMDIAEEFDLPVLEDATEAMGSFMRSGRFDGRHAGAIGDIGVFSFNANKIITTGGGGMIVSAGGAAKDAEARANRFIAEARYLTTTAKDDGIYFAHDEVGYNYRMLNLQAALGVSQIDELERFIGIKKRNFGLYAKLLENAKGISLLPFPKGQRANHWFYSLYVDDGGADGQEESRRDRIMKALISEGIQCRPVWKLVHTQKAYKTFKAENIERAPIYERHILNPPCSTSLGEDDIRYICERLIAATGA